MSESEKVYGVWRVGKGWFKINHAHFAGDLDMAREVAEFVGGQPRRIDPSLADGERDLLEIEAQRQREFETAQRQAEQMRNARPWWRRLLSGLS